jgi:hypothetical protein
MTSVHVYSIRPLHCEQTIATLSPRIFPPPSTSRWSGYYSALTVLLRTQPNCLRSLLGGLDITAQAWVLHLHISVLFGLRPQALQTKKLTNISWHNSFRSELVGFWAENIYALTCYRRFRGICYLLRPEYTLKCSDIILLERINWVLILGVHCRVRTGAKTLHTLSHERLTLTMSPWEKRLYVSP